TRTVSSARARVIASRSPCITPYDIALRRSGRLMVTRATPAEISNSTSSIITGSVGECAVRWPGHARAGDRCRRRVLDPARHPRLVQATVRDEVSLGLAAGRRPRDPARARVLHPAPPLLGQPRLRPPRRLVRLAPRIR